MNYQLIIDDIENSQHLISMTPAAKIVEIGYTSGMNPETNVLDLCCGYGEMLKIWHEAFGIRGTGVDRYGEFIDKGKERLEAANISTISLICADVLEWQTKEKFDFACLCGEEFGGVEGTVRLLEKFVKPGGKLVVGTRFSKVDDPPPELIEFEGETLSLSQIYETFSANGYVITSVATDTHAEWERYIMWSARRNLEALRNDPDNADKKAWYRKWYETYFEFRRDYEGYGTFVIEKV